MLFSSEYQSEMKYLARENSSVSSSVISSSDSDPSLLPRNSAAATTAAVTVRIMIIRINDFRLVNENYLSNFDFAVVCDACSNSVVVESGAS